MPLGKSSHVCMCCVWPRLFISFVFCFFFLFQQSFEESIPDKVPQPKSDSELRQTFGITADLIVSLQKIDVSKELQAQNEKRLINKRTLDGIRKMIHDSKIETKLKQLIQTQVRFFLMLKTDLYQSNHYI